MKDFFDVLGDNFHLQIDMEWMDLEPDPTGCKFDALKISDFNSSTVDNYCGSKSYFPIISKVTGRIV